MITLNVLTLYLESCSSEKTDGVSVERSSSRPQSESDLARPDLSNWTHIWMDSIHSWQVIFLSLTTQGNGARHGRFDAIH